MKIKFLLVPAAIVISIVILIWHVWPTWFNNDLDDSITTLRQDIKTEKEELDNVKKRKQNVDMLASELQGDTDNRDLIFNYYPVVRKEEDIVNKINHIALGSGIFLTEMTFEYGKIGKKNDSEEILAIPDKEENKVTSVAESEKTLLANNANLEKYPNFIEADINAYGDYEQIKNFLYSLFTIGLLNNVQSFDIHKTENVNTIDGESITNNRLNVDIKVSFGYIVKKKGEAVDLINNPLFASESFNFEFLNENKNLMSEKYPNSEIGERGILNPFAF